MVAYGFKPGFEPDIVARVKRQTIRMHRKRHARLNERVQLFIGLRTKHCRKIIEDPVCTGVDEVVFDLRRASPIAVEFVESAHIEVNGIPLVGAAADAYARSDGFNGIPPNQFAAKLGIDPARTTISPFHLMARFWVQTHGRVLFDGVAIRWEDRP